MQKLLFILTLFITGINTHAFAQKLPPENHWDRNSAAAAINSVDISTAVDELGDIASLTDARDTLNKLDRLENRPDWPLPAREAAIYRFTRSLAELPRDAIAAGVMDYLKNYQARTLVPHEEHSDALIPLFNIRAAATGVENGWLRQEFAYEAQLLIADSPEALVVGFESATSQTRRAAFVEALKDAPLRDVIAVQDETLERLANTPALTPLIATTAAITTDAVAIERLLADGSGVGLSSALENIGQQLPPGELSGLLVFAIQQAPAINASMAIAAWAPRLRHDTVVRDLLVARLSDAELGASAALALAHQPDIQTIKILQDTAAGDSIAARRAQMALDLNRDQLTEGTRP